ncbi:MAG: hypothetical protein D3910_00440 [Candidatus Electrothrix sp. ATG2]|nr:hypothetical protein [Candidatus Electrothrix sp. ATG2]
MNTRLQRRIQHRVGLKEHVAIIMDEGCYYSGVLKEVSLNGFRVTFSPIHSRLISCTSLSLFRNLSTLQVKKFRVLISKSFSSLDNKIACRQCRQEEKHMVTAYPRWRIKKKTLLEIGFELPESSTDWKLFVHQKMLETH